MPEQSARLASGLDPQDKKEREGKGGGMEGGRRGGGGERGSRANSVDGLDNEMVKAKVSTTWYSKWI